MPLTQWQAVRREGEQVKAKETKGQVPEAGTGSGNPLPAQRNSCYSGFKWKVSPKVIQPTALQISAASVWRSVTGALCLFVTSRCGFFT